MTMRILLLSYYYPPDLAAFRVEAMVEALLAHPGGEAQIDLLTTCPNRYAASYVAGSDGPQRPGLCITRIALPRAPNNFRDQARGFAAYAHGVRKAIKGKEYDLILASSSRLMTAALAASIARARKTPLYLDIRDIFVDVLPELFPGLRGNILARLFAVVERLTINQASRINLVSPGFLGYFVARYPHKRFATFTNGIDDLFFQSALSQGIPCAPAGRLKIVYAGNIGAGQGLEKIIPQLAQRLTDRASFYVIGHGGTLHKLRDELQRLRITNVELIAPMSRAQLINHYRQADVLFLHLNTFKAFLKVIPSKLFEYAATGKPILAGLDGYSKHFATTHIANTAVFAPADLESAIAALARLRLEPTDRSAFIRDYARTTIQQHMAIDILSTR
ncbi:glycosyltransferase family 4 protein [Pseudomonas sp. WMBT8]|uniref:glycosyltransferase family 4 protein n=1 Tax=Pseudomonas sp. WMBT8 TaxID=3414496 RepID=UPI003D80229B